MVQSAPATAAGSLGSLGEQELPLGLVFSLCMGRGRDGGRTRQRFGDCSARASRGQAPQGFGDGGWVIPNGMSGASWLRHHIKHRDEALYKYYIELPRLLFTSGHCKG